MNRFLALLIAVLFFTAADAQYILNGAAQKNSCNCYTLTPPVNTQSGSVWNSNKINLNNPFDFWFNVFLGCNDGNGADGIVFILQPINTSIGTTGEGMGFFGVSPSIGIALDTWQNSNLNDPAFDHISIQANGVVNHTSDLAGPIPASASSDNIEDCQWHKLRVSWDPVTKWLRTYFDGVLRVEKQVDLITQIFNNDPMVYWGFTGATGGSVNLQQFCTALDPIFTTNFPSNAACITGSIQFTSQSESFAPIISYNWDFGDGSTSVLPNPPAHTYSAPGAYPVKLTITGLDGCVRDTTRIITVGSIPAAGFSISNSCEGRQPALNMASALFGVSYSWELDGIFFSSLAQPDLSGIPVGTHQLKLTVHSPLNCGPDATDQHNFVQFPKPTVSIDYLQQCTSLNFTGTQLDNSTSIQQWNWSFGDGLFSTLQNPTHNYSQYSSYTVRSWAVADNGCSSDTVSKQVQIIAPQVDAGVDTVIVRNQPYQLSASGNGNFLWTPATGLSGNTIANPVALLQDQQTYQLKLTTAQGCIAIDTITLKVMDGPFVYVPDGFTPNGDGKNDVLRPVYVGISRLENFIVFNRWGQTVFRTNSMKEGWNGMVKGKGITTETFVWQAVVFTAEQKKMIFKGTITLIR